MKMIILYLMVFALGNTAHSQLIITESQAKDLWKGVIDEKTLANKNINKDVFYYQVSKNEIILPILGIGMEIFKFFNVDLNDFDIENIPIPKARYIIIDLEKIKELKNNYPEDFWKQEERLTLDSKRANILEILEILTLLKLSKNEYLLGKDKEEEILWAGTIDWDKEILKKEVFEFYWIINSTELIISYFPIEDYFPILISRNFLSFYSIKDTKEEIRIIQMDNNKKNQLPAKKVKILPFPIKNL